MWLLGQTNFINTANLNIFFYDSLPAHMILDVIYWGQEWPYRDETEIALGFD